MFTNTIHGGGAPSRTTSVYYTGSSTLLEGYTLCYDFNAYNVNQENASQTTPDVGEEYWADARRICVEKCTEQNKVHFAGVVAAQSDGVVGPGWVTIHAPGSICNVYAYSSVDSEIPVAGTEGAGTAAGEIINLVVGQWYMKLGGFPGVGAAMTLQDVDRSSTAGLVMCELQTGLPSGGISFATMLTTSATAATQDSLSVILGYVPAYVGWYCIQEPALGSTIVSTQVVRADGRWAGQKCAFFNSTLISCGVSIQISGFTRATTTALGAGNLAVTSAYFDISAANEYVIFEFDGYNWTSPGGHESIVT